MSGMYIRTCDSILGIELSFIDDLHNEKKIKIDPNLIEIIKTSQSIDDENKIKYMKLSLEYLLGTDLVNHVILEYMKEEIIYWIPF